MVINSPWEEVTWVTGSLSPPPLVGQITTEGSLRRKEMAHP